MKKTDLVAVVSEKAEISKKDAEKAVNAVIEAIQDSVKNDDKVQITGFGTFELRTREARTGCNPRTKEQIEIPASKIPAFKAGKAFKEAVNK